MSRLFVVGDTHGDLEIAKLSTHIFKKQKELTKNDYVCILGDFGLVWTKKFLSSENYWLNWLESKNFTTLFIPGNHECYPRLREYPLEDWHGGKIRRIRPSVLMLERGYVFEICNKKIFCMGGASSTDKFARVEGRDWWPEEMPSREEYELAVKNLEKYNNSVDYIFTHTAPTSVIQKITHYLVDPDELTAFLDNYVNSYVNFKYWFCGHFHQDRTVDDKYFFMYEDIMGI